MKVMVFVKATQDSETEVMPSEQLLTEMGQFNKELAKAGSLGTRLPIKSQRAEAVRSAALAKTTVVH